MMLSFGNVEIEDDFSQLSDIAAEHVFAGFEDEEGQKIEYNDTIRDDVGSAE